MHLRLDRNQRRGLVGALLAASFFLIEAGIIEIMIGLDLECRRSIAGLRLAPDPFSACMPEWQWLFMHATSRGFLWLFNQTSPALLAGLSMGVVYSIIGGVCASIFRWKGILVYLAIHLGIASVVAGLGYLGRYIA